jgi:hypothetical protein
MSVLLGVFICQVTRLMHTNRLLELSQIRGSTLLPVRVPTAHSQRSLEHIFQSERLLRAVRSHNAQLVLGQVRVRSGPVRLRQAGQESLLRGWARRMMAAAVAN